MLGGRIAARKPTPPERADVVRAVLVTLKHGSPSATFKVGDVLIATVAGSGSGAGVWRGGGREEQRVRVADTQNHRIRKVSR